MKKGKGKREKIASFWAINTLNILWEGLPRIGAEIKKILLMRLR